MTKLNTFEIVNQVDNKCFTVYVEWFNSHFKIILLESETSPLSGEMDTKDINYFSNELGKSSDEYLQETKEIFRGKEKEIQFFVKNRILEWKRNRWTLGKIELFPILEVTVLAETFQQLLKFYQSIQDKISILEEENKNLKNTNADLLSKVEKIIKSKTVMEQDLYNKFILLLNAKKEKIRELETNIKEKQSTVKSVFNACTDESEESDDDNQKLQKDPTTSTKVNKRKSSDNINHKSIQKVRKNDSNLDINYTDSNETINKACVDKDSVKHSKTLKNKSNFEEQSCSSTSKTSRSSLNFAEEESEEELFSQL